MRAGAIRSLVSEARELASTLEGETEEWADGGLVVSGMLAEQLARELGRGAWTGVVRVGDGVPLREGDVAVRVIAGEPGEDDVAVVRSAAQVDVPVVLVQLWPQADWTPPFVLSPFVVECRPGESFPIGEIAGRIAEATGAAGSLAERVPVLRGAFERRAVLAATVRAALLAARGRDRDTRPLITREQARLLVRLHPALRHSVGGVQPETAGLVAALTGWGFAVQHAARAARAVLPGRVADVAVAAGGTWAFAQAARVVRSRLADES